MRLFQLTIARARALDVQWRATLHRYRGAAPSGLGVAHMLAESNGTIDPVVRNRSRQPVGLMQIPLRRSRRLGYHEAALKTPVNNIYIWGRLTNDDAEYVQTAYPTWWTTPNLSFWLAVRLFFLLDKPVFDSLLTQVSLAGTSYQSLPGIQAWIRTTMTAGQRVSTYNRTDLRRIADHLDAMREVVQALEGPQFVSERFSERFIVAPGTDETKFRTVTARGAA